MAVRRGGLKAARLHAASFALAALTMVGTPAAAAEIKVMCSSAIDVVMHELVPRFEKASGHKVNLKYGIGSALKQQIVAGETFDAAILVGLVDDLVQQGKMVAGTPVIFGHTGYGVAVRKGAPKPDISTVAAYKSTMLAAKSVAYTEGGGSGAYFLRTLERLGIAEEMKPKLKPIPSDSARAVANGEAEMTVNGMAPIMRATGIDLVGPLPAELQSYSSFVGGLSTGAANADAGRAFLAFFASPEAAAVFKSKGVEPGPAPK